MKSAIAFVSIISAMFGSIIAQAQSFEYACRLSGSYTWPLKISVDESRMVMFDQYDSQGTGKMGRVVFDNMGIKGGRGKMKDRLKFRVNYSVSEVSPGEITEYFLSQELISGGFQLRNGSYGGFMTFAGQGYSYETYTCFRTSN